MNRILAALATLICVVVMMGHACAQPAGPGPTPNPWITSGSQIYYNGGCVTVPSNVTGGCKGAGSINTSALYVGGAQFTPSSIASGNAGNLAYYASSGTGLSALALGSNVLSSLQAGLNGPSGLVGYGGALGTIASGDLTSGTGYQAVNLTGTLHAAQFPALTGDATTTAGSLAVTVGNLSNVTNGSLANAGLLHPSVTIGSTGVTLGATQTTLAGLASVTSTTFIGALTGHASLDLALTGGTLSGALTVVTAFTATGLVTNADLVNSSITINSITCTLGSTCAITGTATSLTAGTTTVTGGPGVLSNATSGGVLVSSTTLPSGLTSPSLIVTTAFTATGLVTNADLVNPALTIGSTGVTLGATQTTLAGLTSVTSTTFVGALTGHASLDLALTGGTLSGALTASGGLTVTSGFTATGLVTNADLVNSSITINSVACTLGSTCAISGSAGSIAAGTTTVTGGPGVLSNASSGGVLVSSTTLPAGLTIPTPTISSPTITGTPVIPGLPGLTANAAGSGVPGLALPETSTATSQWFIYAAPTLSSTSISGNPAFYIQRNPAGSGGTHASLAFAMNLLDVVPSGDNFYEWGLQVTLENGALSSNGAGANSPENVGFSVFSSKVGTSSQNISATWGILIQATDPTGFASATSGLTGMELDIGCGIGANGQAAVNCGADSNQTRTGLQIVGNGLTGSHVFAAINIGYSVSGGVFDNGLYFGGISGAQVGTAINLTGAIITTGINMGGNDIQFDGPSNQFIMSATGSGSLNYLDILVNGVVDVFHIAGSNGTVTIGTHVLLSGLSSSSAATTGTVCWTTGGNLTVDTTLACLSSLEELKNIRAPIDRHDALDEIDQLHPVWGSWRRDTPEYVGGDTAEQAFLTAHQVESVDRRLVAYGNDGALRGVRYMEMAAFLSAGVAALDEYRISDEAKIAELRIANDNLRSEVIELRRRLP